MCPEFFRVFYITEFSYYSSNYWNIFILPRLGIFGIEYPVISMED
jgi:hypothetical protein